MSARHIYIDNIFLRDVHIRLGFTILGFTNYGVVTSPKNPLKYDIASNEPLDQGPRLSAIIRWSLSVVVIWDGSFPDLSSAIKPYNKRDVLSRQRP